MVVSLPLNHLERVKHQPPQNPMLTWVSRRYER
jgi:hypothetical protein